ncbi:DUF5131 family protein [Desulfitobacterium chlororespirans]|uniref:DUF5131 family protein n=1 Tax=Desulfitobacterium chlororespirans TaxID=51616 RepID=UPI000A057F29|nr:DUF5131 family protein [Desulfitobacterium chlororespirans]
MNKSKIDWTDYTWNPVTGCYHTCPYCYARRQSARFAGDVRLNLADPRCERYQGQEGFYILHEPFITRNERSISYPFGFAPTLHEYRFDWPGKVKNGANIFVGSMTDLFGYWVPDEWIQLVFTACERFPQHNYLFLTKNPKRYSALARARKLPSADNFWYGTTLTHEGDDVYTPVGINTFLSIEPLLEPISFTVSGDLSFKFSSPWVIVGAETGRREGKVVPEKAWIRDIVNHCREVGTPVFMKESLRELMGEEFLQEFPVGLLRKEPSLKLKKKLWETCKFCGVENPKKEMIALLYRKKRGESAKRLGYACPKCFSKLAQAK